MKTNLNDLGVISDVTCQVKVKMFDFLGLVTSASKISMLSSNKANESAWIVSLTFVSIIRAGEMIPEVEGTRPWGPSRKRAPKCLKGPKTTHAIMAIAKKQFKRSKKGPFSLYIGSPWSLPGNVIDGARGGRSLPVPRFLQP